jgi:hypothetical protein
VVLGEEEEEGGTRTHTHTHTELCAGEERVMPTSISATNGVIEETKRVDLICNAPDRSTKIAFRFCIRGEGKQEKGVLDSR